MSTYELPISANYIPDWTLCDALREIFQNAQDAANQLNSSYDFTYADNTLTVTNNGAWLDRSTLLLGSSTKTTDDTLVGKFGEGYKLASLVFLRKGCEVIIDNANYNEKWEASLQKSKRFGGEEILTFSIDGRIKKKHTNDKVLSFIIKGLPKNVWKEYKELYNLNLLDSSIDKIEWREGEVLLDKKFKGRIFVEGLYIGTMENVYYGYNFNASVIPLDRDRKVLPSFDTLWAISRIWSETDSEYIYPLLEEGVEDLKYFSPHSENSSSVKLATDFISYYGPSAYPVKSQLEAEALQRMDVSIKPIFVTDQKAKFLRSTGLFKDYNLSSSSSLRQRLLNFKELVEDKLDDEELNLLNSIINSCYI